MWRSITSGLRSLFRKKRVGQELDEELNGFLEMAAEEKSKARAAGTRFARFASNGEASKAQRKRSALPAGNLL